MADKEQEKALLSQVEGTGEKARVIAMKDKDETLGYAVVELQEKDLVIHKLSAGKYSFEKAPDVEEIFVLDSLMRSAASFGENFGADRIVTAFPDFFDFFKRRGFQVESDYACTPMSTIVHYE